MWKFKVSPIFVVIVLIGVTHGVLVVGPKFIRANKDYSLVISNFNAHQNDVNLMLKLEGQTENYSSVLNVTKFVSVARNTNRMISFNMPENLSPGSYKILIDGQQGFSFHTEAELVYLSKSISGLIQIDKPVFKPGDTVKFRVIVLDTELKPPAGIDSICVKIYDPQQNVFRSWNSAKLYTGVFESDLHLPSTPTFGVWAIVVQVGGEKLVKKTFEVMEYVMSSFDVRVVQSTIPLEEHQALNLTITANYHFGKPVQGFARIELYLEDDKLDQKQDLQMYGIGQIELHYKGILEIFNDQQDVRVTVTFIEKFTNRTEVVQEKITVYKYPYQVQLIKDNPQFYPGQKFKCALQFRYHDGSPAAGITGNMDVSVKYKPVTDTSDSNGLIELEIEPAENIDEIDISFSNETIGFYFVETINKITTYDFINLAIKSPIKLNSSLRILVTCTERMTFFVYYIVSRGNIIESGYRRLNHQHEHLLQLVSTENMIPKAQLFVATVTDQKLVYDFVDLDFHELLNSFDLSIDKQQLSPGQPVELRMSGRPGSYVGLAAYDKGLLTYSKNHDLLYEDIMQTFDRFHSIDKNEFDQLHNIGLFARTFDGFGDDSPRRRSKRNGLGSSIFTKAQDYRKHFAESWLWKNFTLPRTGRFSMTEVVPDAITSWQLTGFSIDPVYGLGIIKKPIDFTMIQPFYIVDNLPYSIKRGETVLLSFTLFNNLAEEHTVLVTLYNVNNQMEIIPKSVDEPSYTESVRVPPNIGVPVTFFVRPRKLGDMVVHVEASISDGLATDALYKVIRVMPESLVQFRSISRFFCFDTYKNESFSFLLDIPKNADIGSRTIKINFITNLYTNVKDSLAKYLSSSSGCGEENMLEVTLNFAVLDYLHAIGSKDQHLLQRAFNLSREACHNQRHCRNKDGSFGAAEGSIYLTTSLANVMQTAFTYLNETDVFKMERTFDWLASKQHSSGRFVEVSSVTHHDMQKGPSNGVAMTSYVLIALLKNEKAKVKHAAVIQRGMKYLSNQLYNINNAYDLSMVAYVMMLKGHNLRYLALEKLTDLSTKSNEGEELYWNSPNSVETTAYALLAFVAAEKYIDALPLMRWLINQRYDTESISSHHVAYVRFMALTKLAEKISPALNDYNIMIKSKKIKQMFRINAEDVGYITYEDFPADTNSIGVFVEGIGSGLLMVAYNYSLDLRNFVNRFQLDLEQQSTGSDNELSLRICVNYIPLLLGMKSDLAMVEVNFPSGYVVGRNPISQQTMFNPIQRFETRHGGTSVVLYYSNMGTERNCFTVTAYKQLKGKLNRAAYVVVYDYYNPNLNAIKVYEVDKQEVREICEAGDCRQ